MSKYKICFGLISCYRVSNQIAIAAVFCIPHFVFIVFVSVPIVPAVPWLPSKCCRCPFESLCKLFWEALSILNRNCIFSSWIGFEQHKCAIRNPNYGLKQCKRAAYIHVTDKFYVFGNVGLIHENSFSRFNHGRFVYDTYRWHPE